MIIKNGSVTLHISVGNGKMGKLPGMNLMPIDTCSGSTSGCRRYCYALKGVDFRSNMRQAWMDNTNAWRNNPNLATGMMVEWLRENPHEVFRVHGSGDFIDGMHFSRWEWIASVIPTAIFYGFSKAPFSLRSGMDSMRIRRSVWHDSPMEIPEVPAAYVDEYPEARKLVKSFNDAPDNAVPCPATMGVDITCIECRWCFTQGWTDKLPVVFRRH